MLRAHRWSLHVLSSLGWIAIAGASPAAAAKCLDVPGSSLADGVQLQQFTCNNTGAQAFQVTP